MDTIETSAPVDSAQRRRIFLTVIIVVSCMLVFVSGFIYKISQPHWMSRGELKAKGAYIFDKPRQLSEFQLLDESNQPFKLANLEDQWSLLFFGFTHCPDVCPTTMAQLKQFYNAMPDGELKDSTQIILVTVDPARDTVEKLALYVNYFDERFVGVTGEFLDIKRFATQLNIPFAKVPGGGENYQVEHSGNVAIVNSRGHYVGFLRAPLDVDLLASTYPSIRHLYPD